MELELRGRELEKREAKNEIQRRRLAEEIEKVCYFMFNYLSYLTSVFILMNI